MVVLSSFQQGPDMQLHQLVDPEAWDAKIPTRAELRALGLDGWKSTAMPELRHEFTARIGFALPSQEALATIARHSRNIIEVGAGSGFWAHQLRRVGVDVIATDLHTALNNYRQKIGAHSPVIRMSAIEAIKAYPDRDVLAIWPCYRRNWLEKAIDHMKPGQLLLYVGEGRGGCTATDGFFRKTSHPRVFDTVEEHYLAQWPGIHDNLIVFRKKVRFMRGSRGTTPIAA